MRIFASYCAKDGLELAIRAKGVMEGQGHEAWMWHHDQSPGVNTWWEIGEAIVDADQMLWICTGGSFESYGQRMEYGIAMNNAKLVAVVRLGEATVPAALTGANWIQASEGDFDRRVLRYALTLPERERTRLGDGN